MVFDMLYIQPEICIADANWLILFKAWQQIDGASSLTGTTWNSFQSKTWSRVALLRDVVGDALKMRGISYREKG